MHLAWLPTSKLQKKWNFNLHNYCSNLRWYIWLNFRQIYQHDIFSTSCMVMTALLIKLHGFLWKHEVFICSWTDHQISKNLPSKFFLDHLKYRTRHSKPTAALLNPANSCFLSANKKLCSGRSKQRDSLKIFSSMIDETECT